MERHENTYDGIPAKLRGENILRRHSNITKEQALLYQKYMLQIQWTSNKLVNQMDVWIKKRGIEPALKWLSVMASEMQSLETPEHDALSQVYHDEEEEKGVPAYGFHKVDTVYEREEPDWMGRQPWRLYTKSVPKTREQMCTSHVGVMSDK